MREREYVWLGIIIWRIVLVVFSVTFFCVVAAIPCSQPSTSSCNDSTDILDFNILPFSFRFEFRLIKVLFSYLISNDSDNCHLGIKIPISVFDIQIHCLTFWLLEPVTFLSVSSAWPSLQRILRFFDQSCSH